MWEYRLIWTEAAPSWWDDAWTAAAAALQRQSRNPEDRPDTYLVLADRPDVGLKLRGKDGEFEVKTRHDARAGWELWEKTPFFGWNALEAARFSVLLQREFPRGAIDAGTTAVDGAKALLTGAGVTWREVTLGKTRMQARADELIPSPASTSIEPSWLAEMVEITGAGPTARSICFETMAPEAGVSDALPSARGAANIGYPAFLIRAVPR
jgi:hypothetical protein